MCLQALDPKVGVCANHLEPEALRIITMFIHNNRGALRCTARDMIFFCDADVLCSVCKLVNVFPFLRSGQYLSRPWALGCLRDCGRIVCNMCWPMGYPRDTHCWARWAQFGCGNSLRSQRMAMD